MSLFICQFAIVTNNKSQSILIKFILEEPMEAYEFPYSPERKKTMGNEVIRKSSIKQRLDAFIQNDFAVLRKGSETVSQELQLKYQNPLVLEYVRGIYDEYHITDPLSGHESFSRVTMTPSGKKTTKKQKMLLMSNQTIKYSSPARLNTSGKPQQVAREFDLVEDESTFIRRDFQNNTTIRASMSYFDVGQELKDQTTSFADLRTKINTLENQHDTSLQRFKEASRRGLGIIVQEESRPILEETFNNQENIPRIQLPILEQGARREDKLYLTEIPSIRKPSQRRREDGGYVDQSFRYCVGCERPLLHANIKHHESTCKEFQFVFQMPAEGIVKYLKRKINKFEEEIKRASTQLLREDTSELQECSQRMMDESRVVSEQGVVTRQFQQQYEKVVDIGKRWCMITEEINKVNWFLKIREKIKKEFQL